MVKTSLRHLAHMVFGDRRDQRLALREAGFVDEASAAAWAQKTLRLAGIDPQSQVEAIALLRRQRPDLTLRTASYIAHQGRTRSA